MRIASRSEISKLYNVIENLCKKRLVFLFPSQSYTKSVACTINLIRRDICCLHIHGREFFFLPCRWWQYERYVCMFYTKHHHISQEISNQNFLVLFNFINVISNTRGYFSSPQTHFMKHFRVLVLLANYSAQFFSENQEMKKEILCHVVATV